MTWPVRLPLPPSQATAARGWTLTAVGHPPAPRHAGQRPYNAVEVRAQVDADTMQADWETALDGLLADWEDVAAGQRDDIAAQVRTAVDNDDPAALVAITVDSAAGAALLAAAMAAMALAAARTMATEAAAQDVHVDPVAPGQSAFTAAAETLAALTAGGLVLAGAREAMRQFGYNPDATQVADAVAEFLRDLSDAPLRAQLGGALTWAQNAGRLATLDAAPTARYYASEILDQNTCRPCARIDGDELPTLDAAQLAYGGGGYLFCEGTVRCRGTMIAVWESS